MNPKVDAFLSKAQNWQEEMELLRTIILDCGLEEDLKWGKPCYSFQNTNFVIIQPFKEYYSLLFFNGALLNDTNNILIKPGENTQAGRQVRFNNLQELKKLKSTLKSYIYKAIEIEKSGLKVVPKPKAAYPIPDEFQSRLDAMPALKKAFEALTPGRQRAYLMHFAAAKQSKTREARVESYLQKILSGKGISDCTCGLSKRMPSCDGSHKFLK
jgi:uncharacterized protein YdeI (YjbR/CyaY-like superfamily)